MEGNGTDSESNSNIDDGKDKENKNCVEHPMSRNKRRGRKLTVSGMPDK